MKKTLLLLLAVFVLCVAVSCGSVDNKPATETTAATDSQSVADTTPTDPTGDPSGDNSRGILKIDPSEYYFCKVFELPEGDFRQAAVDHMRKCASIEWVCSEDFAVSESFNSWGIDLTFKKGQKYTGIPYSDTKVSYDQFLSYLDNGTYTCDSSKWKEVYGVQCVSSIMNSIQQFDPKTAGFSTEMMPSYDAFQGVICGNYNVPKGVKRTNEIITANTQEDIFKAYETLKKGDIIITKDDIADSSHLRMLVEDPTIVKNQAGKINPKKSYVKTIEQTNMFDKTRKDGVITTWYVDHTYDFSTLYTSNYVPVTLEIYSKDISECEIPYITLDKELTVSQLLAGSSASVVKSNFPIRHVTLNIYDKSGTLVKHAKAYDMANSYMVNLRGYVYGLTDGLANGDYTFVLSAGIAIGTVEMQRMDFTYNK